MNPLLEQLILLSVTMDNIVAVAERLAPLMDGGELGIAETYFDEIEKGMRRIEMAIAHGEGVQIVKMLARMERDGEGGGHEG